MLKNDWTGELDDVTALVTNNNGVLGSVWVLN
jgi:hypothetical protein